MSTVELETYLHRHIPLSREIGIRVIAASAAEIRLAAPLEPNLNHQRTAFGGSLSAVAILSAWSLLHLRLAAGGFSGDIVIQGNSMEFLRPALTEFEAVCRAPVEERWEVFARTLAQRGRARIELDAEVLAGDSLVASFRGQYVALAERRRAPR